MYHYVYTGVQRFDKMKLGIVYILLNKYLTCEKVQKRKILEMIKYSRMSST